MMLLNFTSSRSYKRPGCNNRRASCYINLSPERQTRVHNSSGSVRGTITAMQISFDPLR